jgi:NADPH2:quinone reductase
MHAIGLREHLPINNPASFLELELPDPIPQGHDILVQVKAVSVNPVDTKVRSKGETEKTPLIIGWDAAGIVKAIGRDVSLFHIGDEVYYAGALKRRGSNAELQLVDERIIAKKPKSLNFEEAAAMPLTTLVAWEALFDRLKISEEMSKNKNRAILIINGSGGVGSSATQIAKHVAGLRVIATGSSKNEKWIRDHGADEVIDYKKDLIEESARLGYSEYDFILDLHNMSTYWDSITKLIAPFGMIASITEFKETVNLNVLKSKSASFAWALMFTRAGLGDDRMLRQHDILETAAKLFDKKTLSSTMTKSYGMMTATNLKKAHEAVEAGHVQGKITLRW